MKLEKRYDADRIRDRVAELAEALDRAFREKPPVVISVLKGSSFFLADLARKMTLPISCEFISVQRAEGSDEILQMDFSTGFPVVGRPVLLLKDVVYSGIVESYLMESLKVGGADSVGLVAIIDKPTERRTEVSADYSLFSTEGGIFVGYGMDHRGNFAHLPYIAEIVGEQ